MIVICGGMFRSGSTWQYQVTNEILAISGRPFRALGYLNPVEAAAAIRSSTSHGEWLVFKTHEVDPIFGRLLGDGQAVGLYCYRDLRDVAYSMAHQLGGGFARAVGEFDVIRRCLRADAFWRAQPRVHLQRYKDWLIDQPKYVRMISNLLGIFVTSEECRVVADKFTFEENRKRTVDLAERIVAIGHSLDTPHAASLTDRESLLHYNHLRSGRVGHWRELATDEEKQILADLCGDWLIEQGYETDYSWAEPQTRQKTQTVAK